MALLGMAGATVGELVEPPAPALGRCATGVLERGTAAIGAFGKGRGERRGEVEREVKEVLAG